MDDRANCERQERYEKVKEPVHQSASLLASHFRLFFHLAAGLQPGLPSAFQNPRPFEACFKEYLRRADADLVVRTGAICNNQAVAGKVLKRRKGEPRLESPFFHVNGALNLVGIVIGTIEYAEINDHHRLVLGQFAFKFFSRYFPDLLKLWLIGPG